MAISPRSKLATLALALLVTNAPAQDRTTKPEPPAWPKLSTSAKQSAKLALRRLLAGDSENANEEATAAARDELLRLGPAVAPLLLRRLGDRDRVNPEPLTEVLDQLVNAKHATLLAKLATKRKPLLLRRYLTARLATFRDPATRPVFLAAAKDKDADLAFYGTLGLCGLRDLDHLDAVFDRCRQDWFSVVALVQATLEPMRGEDPADHVLRRMGKHDERDLVTGLRLLRSLAPKPYAGLIRIHLDSRHNSVKKATINALRVIVDGAKPLEKLSVFQAITMAKQWRDRL